MAKSKPPKKPAKKPSKKPDPPGKLDGIKPVDPTFSPAPVIQWGIAPPPWPPGTYPPPIIWGPDYVTGAEQALYELNGIVEGIWGNVPWPTFGPIPRPRRADGKLVIPGLRDPEGDLSITLTEGTNPTVVAAWNNVALAVSDLIRAYGEVLPDPE